MMDDRSWSRIYAAVIVAAVLVMLALWWFSRTWNIPLGAA